MATVTFSVPTSVATYLNDATGLSAVADGGNVLGPIIDNSANHLYGDFEVFLKGVTTSGTPFVSLYKILAIDTSSFSDGSGTVDPPAGTPLWTHGIVTGTGDKRVTMTVVMSPGTQRFLFESRVGTAMSAASNTIKYRLYSETVA